MLKRHPPSLAAIEFPHLAVLGDAYQLAVMAGDGDYVEIGGGAAGHGRFTISVFGVYGNVM